MESKKSLDVEQGKPIVEQAELVVAVAAEHSAVMPTKLEVTAPSNLPGDFMFTCEAQGNRYTVRVPPEGVKQGQIFQADVVSVPNEKPLDENIETHDIPRGHWRDGLFDCFNHCPSCLMAFCCQPCLLGQVLGRYRLGFCGEEVSSERGSCTPFGVLWILIFVLFTMAFFQGWAEGMADQTGEFPSWYEPLSGAVTVLNYSLGLYCIILTKKVYSYMARRHGIDDGNGCNHWLVSIFCRPCATAQMIRHSANHEKYPYNMCNERGLSPSAPTIV